ncbi:MAG: VOC family protein [Campylobacterales bacterium]|nr:VOC family protein [Campylobacterales bacterium]
MKKVTPNLAVRDIAFTVAFYTEVLGFTLNMAVPETQDGIDTSIDETKRYVYAMVSQGEAAVMFQHIESLNEDIGPHFKTPTGMSGTLYFESDDAESYYETVKERAEILKPLGTAWYGMKEFYLRDCNGYILGFASAAS